jgi:hypothetical protein
MARRKPLGCGRSTVQDSLNRLAEIGAIEKRKVESVDGRDSAHWYRVVLDRVVNPDDFAAFDEEDEEEFGPVSRGQVACRPADVAAPPAGIRIPLSGTTPPAGPGPAPINVTLNDTSNDKERESVRATSDEEDPKKIERKFKAWYPTWPSYLQSSEDAARKAFVALTAEERDECIARTPAFIAAVRSTKQPRFVYAAVYLSERAWQRMGDPTDDIGPPTMSNPFSQAWCAMRFSELLHDPVTPPVVPTAFQLSELRKGGEAAARVNRERRLAYGWPKVNTMHRRADMAEGMTVPPWLVKLSESFVGVHRDSLEAAAWRKFHDEMGWPWLPVPAGVKMLFVPAGEPAQAIAAFREAVAREAGDDNAA